MSFIINPYAFAAPFHTKAVDFDGSTEYMLNSTAQTIGIANAWTISVWFKLDVVNVAQVLFSFRNWNVDLVNYIQFSLLSDGTLRYVLANSSGTIFKLYTTSFSLSASTIYNSIFTWDGTNLNITVNGTDDTPTKTTDNSGTMTDTNRKTDIGSDRGGSSSFTNGLISKVDVWNTALSSSEKTALYDGGNGYKLDTRVAKGNYTSTANLKHQWALGKDDTSASTIGQDYISSGGINVGTNAANISSADVVSFV